MDAIEEVVNIPVLFDYLDESIRLGGISDLIAEIALQSQVEFNLNEDEEAMLSEVDEQSD